MAASERRHSFRVCVVVESPVDRVTYALQRRDGTLDGPIQASPEQQRFEATIRLGAPLASGQPNLLGEYVSGPPSDRFIYINSGRRAGQANSCWDRRAKVKLSSLSAEWIQTAMTEHSILIEGRILGAAPDGGPCCATVSLVGSGWVIVREAAS